MMQNQASVPSLFSMSPILDRTIAMHTLVHHPRPDLWDPKYPKLSSVINDKMNHFHLGSISM
jgi:hypothetical protein